MPLYRSWHFFWQKILRFQWRSHKVEISNGLADSGTVLKSNFPENSPWMTKEYKSNLGGQRVDQLFYSKVRDQLSAYLITRIS